MKKLLLGAAVILGIAHTASAQYPYGGQLYSPGLYLPVQPYPGTYISQQGGPTIGIGPGYYYYSQPYGPTIQTYNPYVAGQYFNNAYRWPSYPSYGYGHQHYRRP